MASIKRAASLILAAALTLSSVAAQAGELGLRLDVRDVAVPAVAPQTTLPDAPLAAEPASLGAVEAPAAGVAAPQAAAASAAALSAPASVILGQAAASAASAAPASRGASAAASDEGAALAGYELGVEQFDLAGKNLPAVASQGGSRGAGASGSSSAAGSNGGQAGSKGKDGGNGGLPDSVETINVQLPLFPRTRSVFLFTPGTEAMAKILAAKAGKDNGFVLLTIPNAGETAHYEVGMLARVVGVEPQADAMHVTFEAIREARIRAETPAGKRADVDYRPLLLGDSGKFAKLKRETKLFLEKLDPSIDVDSVMKMDDPQMVNTLSFVMIRKLDLDRDVQRKLLSADTLVGRLAIVVEHMRDAVLSKQDDGDKDAAEIQKKIEQSGMPDNVRSVAEQELRNLREQKGAEREGTKNYLTWLTDVPWKARTQDNLDLNSAEAQINESHTGLQMVKDRIVEFLAVRKATGTKKGAVLAFVGPPGVGKTSLAKAIAKAMGRRFVRKSLGGKKDLTDLIGHGRTYLKSRPGAIIRKMKEAGVKNPVFLLDEGEKAGDDLMSGLLEILDKEQNDTFEDTYMEVPYDLSEVLFIVTINDLDKVSAPMRDRMEIIDFTSYTLKEKMRIAKNHILAQQRADVGLKPDQGQLDDETLKFIIEGYTKESGVRNVQASVQKLFRKELTRAMKAGEQPKARLTIEDVRSFLGRPKYLDRKPWPNKPGDAWGLGVNAHGGSLLNVQARMRPGKGELTLRQQMLEMIRDSSENAMQVVYDVLQEHGKKYGADPKLLEENKFSLSFVPAGKVDGPSAGITMTTALISLLSKRKVRGDVAMTGEIDMGGRVHAIGGLKEKILAAYAGGKKTVLFPSENLSDLDDIDPEIRDEMNLVPVSTIDEVLDRALEPAPAQPDAATQAK